jgi:hypothetical protein
MLVGCYCLSAGDWVALLYQEVDHQQAALIDLRWCSWWSEIEVK